MCLGTFSRRGAVASATIYPCAECASSRSIFIVWKRSFLYDKKEAAANATTSQFPITECPQIVHSVIFYFFSLDQKLNPYFVFKARIRLIASFVFSCVPKPVRRKYPSPLAPNPEPGVPTTCASFKSLSKNSQEVRLSGVFNQT